MPRVCSRCRKEKSLEDFYAQPDTPSGLRYYCRQCEAERQRHTRAAYKARNTGRPPLREPGPAPGAGAESAARPVREREVLPAHAPRPLPSSRRLVLAVPDAHFPFHSHAWLSWLLDLAAEVQPDAIVQLGDLFDMFAFAPSKYARSSNLHTPNEELDLARQHAAWMWAELRRLCPKAECYQLMGNHDTRARKRALEHFAAAERFVEDGVRELLTFDGVTLIPDTRERLELDGVAYLHGYLRAGAHAKAARMPCVVGHLHRGYVLHVEDGVPWEMCAGWGGDVSGSAFGYVAQRRAHGTTLGAGVVDGYGPRFVPMGPACS